MVRGQLAIEALSFIHNFHKCIFNVKTVSEKLNRNFQAVSKALGRLAEMGQIYSFKDLGYPGLYTKYKEIYSGQVDRYDR